MKLLRLYIENFMCHEYSYLDFSQFSSALIVGKADNNDLYSNGVGKTTIFKAIEYVLFNQADVNLDKIIRDDANACKITIDFDLDQSEYRLVRTRTKKGTTDISLYQRNAIEADLLQSHHTPSKYSDIYCATTDEKYWKDLSGRRAADTEKDVAKLLKINFKSFRSTVHFLQNDFTGLTTATPEKRKGILKEALNLAIYSKLEKMAKDKSNAISKDLEKHQTIIETLANPETDLIALNQQLAEIESAIEVKNSDISIVQQQINAQAEHINSLNKDHSILKNNFIQLLDKEKQLNIDKDKITLSINEYTAKKSNIIKSANALVLELKLLKEEQTKLDQLNYSEIDDLNQQVNDKKSITTEYSTIIQSHLLKMEELKIPFPADATCKHCRQPLSDEHKKNCLNQIEASLKESQNIILNNKKLISENNIYIDKLQQQINYLNASKNKLQDINNKIAAKNKEINDKKLLHGEYGSLLNKFQEDLKVKNEELNFLDEQLANSSKEEADTLHNTIQQENITLSKLNSNLNILNKELANSSNTKAVIAHNIQQKIKDKSTKESLQKNVLDLQSKYSMYPSVLQAFSSTGIPNLIIQNVLDDLQIEANTLLNQLKPALQLSFFVEKTKADGSESDTLDILYYLNGKERHYEQLSGAQKLAVTFSLKLGLSFLLQKMIGTNIGFLLLDEIDQSLDKASVDAFADIVKFFQKDFTILIITHNDRLKDKFKHLILVEQDSNMVSKAQVLNNV